MSDELHDWYRSVSASESDELKLDFAVALERAISDKGLNKTQLAKLAGVSPARITKVLRGDTNLTIESMVKIAALLDCRVHLHIARKNAHVRWFEVHIPLSNRLTGTNQHYYSRSKSATPATVDDELLAL